MCYWATWCARFLELKSYGTSFRWKKKGVEILLFSKEIIALCFFEARLLHKLHTSFPSNKMVVEEEAYGVCKNNTVSSVTKLLGGWDLYKIVKSLIRSWDLKWDLKHLKMNMLISNICDVFSLLERFCSFEQHNLVSWKEIRISNIKACAFELMAKSYSLHLQKHFCWLTTIDLKA